MRVRTGVKIGLILIVAIFVAAVVILMNLDFNQFKPQIAAEAKKTTGRELTIEGDLGLNLFTLSPGLTVDGVRFANAPWGSRPDMASIKRFEVKVGILSLLSGTLDVHRIVLEGADILIERNKDGVGNYEFETVAKQEPADKSAPPEPTEPKETGLPALNVAELTVNASRLTYMDAASGQSLVLAIDTLEVQAQAGRPLELDLRGSYNEAPFTVTGEFGEIAQLLQPTRPWPVKMQAEAGGARVALAGSIAKPAEAAGLDLQLDVTGSDLSRTSQLAQAPVPPLGPYSIGAKITGSLDQTVELTNLAAKVGNSSLSGRAALRTKGRPHVSAKLSSELLDLADFVKTGPEGDAAGKRGAGSPGAAPGASSGAGERRLFSADPLPLDGLKAADADIEVEVRKLMAQGSAAENLKVNLTLKNGDLSVQPFGADVVNGRLDGSLRLNAAQATPRIDVKLNGDKIDIGKLLTDLEVTDLLQGVIKTEVALQGQGNSVRAIMASLNGNTSIVMGQGRMRSDAIDLYAGGAVAAVTQIVFGKKQEYTVVNCIVNQFDIKQGVATNKALLFDTQYATVTGTGTINLGTEQLNLEIDPRPKSATITTAVPLQIRGTLAEPSFRVNPAAAAAKVGGLVGAFVFPPAAALALGDLGTAEANPCMQQARSEGQPQAAPERPTGLPGTIEDAGKEVKDAIDKGLRGLFGR